MSIHVDAWLVSSTMTLHGRGAHDFASLSSCEQMERSLHKFYTTRMEATQHTSVLDLVPTDVPDPVVVQVDSQLGPQITVLLS